MCSLLHNVWKLLFLPLRACFFYTLDFSCVFLQELCQVLQQPDTKVLKNYMKVSRTPSLLSLQASWVSCLCLILTLLPSQHRGLGLTFFPYHPKARCQPSRFQPFAQTKSSESARICSCDVNRWLRVRSERFALQTLFKETAKQTLSIFVPPDHK